MLLEDKGESVGSIDSVVGMKGSGWSSASDGCRIREGWMKGFPRMWCAGWITVGILGRVMYWILWG